MALLPSRALARGVIRILTNQLTMTALLFAHFFPELPVVDAFTKSSVGLQLRHVPANEPSPLSLSMLIVQSAGQPGLHGAPAVPGGHRRRHAVHRSP